MKVRHRRRELLNDYLKSLAIACVIAIGVAPLMGARANPLLFIPFSGFLFGSAFFLLGTVRTRIRLKSFVLNVLAQTVLMGATVFICFYLIVWFFVALEYPRQAFTATLFAGVTKIVVDFGWLHLLGLGLAGLINFSFLISKKLGPGVLVHWITGKYHTPREEELVFMFVDMKDSTMLAEQLGAIKFSGLVRDFFRDMTVPLLESRGRVSHYIGDEAVLYWKPKDAVKAKGCVAFFKWFEEAIHERAPYYQATYGLVPDFKAGMHIGPVVATEVGEVKSEIVFHGDVLNTTARIQSMCNERGERLLASRLLAAKLALPEGAIMSALGPVRLKGKAEEIELVAIE